MHEKFMIEAIKEANKSLEINEVPVGAVIVKNGKIMFEITGVDEAIAREALRLASHKLSVKTKFVKKEEVKDGDSLGN